MSEISIIRASSALFDRVKEIRINVFVKEQGVELKEEFDKYDNEESNSYYVLLFDNEIPVSTARLCIDDTKYKIGRIAVLKDYRGNHYGAAVVEKAVELAFEKGAESVFVDAQNYAVPFYEKLGFRVIGNQIFDRGLPHIPMKITKGGYYGKEKE